MKMLWPPGEETRANREFAGGAMALDVMGLTSIWKGFRGSQSAHLPQRVYFQGNSPAECTFAVKVICFA
jgi:hypothetical protein